MKVFRRYKLHISIHSPRMGRDMAAMYRKPSLSFQSTLPAWGETGNGNQRERLATYFNPLSPHGERRFGNSLDLPATLISIHSPRMGRDSKRTQLFEEKNWRICTTLYLFASKEVLPADKKTF